MMKYKHLKIAAGISLFFAMVLTFSISAKAGAENKNCRLDGCMEVSIDIKALLDEQIAQMETQYWNLVIAKVDHYVNVRSLPGEDGEILGKLYNNSVGEFLEEENGWYKIVSGSVTGYVKAEYCVTGIQAVELAKELGTRLGRVKTVTAYVREGMSKDAEIMGYLAMDDEVILLEEGTQWCKVSVEEGEGYVLTELIEPHWEYVTAESKEEEQTRLAEEKRKRDAAREAAYLTAKNVAAENTSAKETTAEPTDIGMEVADFACQFVGNPYKWGGTSLTEGADCSGFVMSVYANFGVELPHSSASDRSVGYEVGSLSEAIPGDIICYSGHVAIYIGDGQIVHASTAKTGIIISNADYRTILNIRRIF